MAADDFTDIEARFDRLPLDEKLRFLERMIRRIRLAHTIDPAAFERDVAEMATDPDLLREWGVTNG